MWELMRVPLGGVERLGWMGGPVSNSRLGLMSPRALGGLLFTTFYFIRQGLNKSLVLWTPLKELLKEKASCK